MGKQRRSLDRCVDIVVGTPGRILKHRDDGNVFLGSVSSFVIDETDTMLEQGFQNDIAALLHPCLYGSKEDEEKGVCRKSAPQVVLTTATMTQAVRRLLNNEESNNKMKSRQQTGSGGPSEGAAIKLPPTMRVLEAAGLHRAVPRLRQVFVDVGPTDKVRRTEAESVATRKKTIWFPRRLILLHLCHDALTLTTRRFAPHLTLFAHRSSPSSPMSSKTAVPAPLEPPLTRAPQSPRP